MKQETKKTKQETSSSPLISVIVPIYNAEKTLRQCVDSILSQDYRDFELLLIDDGSMDNSPAICDDYAVKDIRVKVFHKPNGGVSSARNLGLENAQGEWITFIDSDDYIENGYFNKIEGRTEDILFLGYKTLFNDVIIKDISVSEEHCSNALPSLINANICNNIVRGPVAKFYRNNIIGNQRFNPQMKVGEDVCFVFGYLAKCNTYYVLRNAQYLVIYCGISDENKYSQSVIQAVSSLMYIKEEFKKIVVKHGIDKYLFLYYINYFKRISRADWYNDKSKWYRNPDVRRMYGYIWDSLPFKDKVKYKVVQLLSVFYC